MPGDAQDEQDADVQVGELHVRMEAADVDFGPNGMTEIEISANVTAMNGARK